MTNQQDTALLPVTEALKPCPFCGGPGTLLRTAVDGSTHIVGCTDCSCCIGIQTASEAITAWNTRAEQAKPSASGEADEATVERVARLLFVRDEGHPVSEATLNYWFSCDENSSGEDADCKRHCDELREDARKIITALRANAPEAQGEVERLRIMSKQKRIEEMTEEERESGDFEGAYDWFVRESRAIYAALSSIRSGAGANSSGLTDTPAEKG